MSANSANKKRKPFDYVTFSDYISATPICLLAFVIALPFVWLLVFVAMFPVAFSYEFLTDQKFGPVDPAGPNFLAIVVAFTSVLFGLEWAKQALDQSLSRRSSTYHDYLDSTSWQGIRGQALELADGRCQVCNQRSFLHAHHRTYMQLGDEQVNDITILCADCHKLFHEGGRMPTSFS